MDQLGIFAKFWEPGLVKTRLADTIGAVPASEVYREFVATTTERLSHIGDRRVLAFWPPDRRDWFVPLAGQRWQLVPQAAGDLGARMRSYFAEALGRGMQHVVLIGSDSPTVPGEHIEQAFRLLRGQPVVLGPTLDGGYYLVGLRDKIPPIFEGIRWSSATVWAETIEKLDRATCSYATLPCWYDVDDATDLVRLRDELRARRPMSRTGKDS